MQEKYGQGLQHMERVVFSRRYNTGGYQWWLIDWYFDNREPMNEVYQSGDKSRIVMENLQSQGWVSTYDKTLMCHTFIPPAANLDAAPIARAHPSDAAGEVPVL